MKNDEQLHKWVNGNLTQEEMEVFKLRPEYDSLVELYENTENLAVPDFDESGMLTQILQQDKKSALPKKGKRVFLSSWVKYGVAAAVLLLAAWIFYPNQNAVQFKTAMGERTEGILPDESTFVLNAESELTYNAKTWASERELSLRGEAFFEVKKGSKFKVETPDGAVEVLGTKFNVRSRANALEVTCQSGKVAVINLQGKVIGELLANDALRISAGKDVEKWKISPTGKASWVDGIFRFRNVPLKMVLEELERQFEVRIQTGNIDAQVQVSCNFQNENLELALKTVLSPLGITYEKTTEQIIILKK